MISKKRDIFTYITSVIGVVWLGLQLLGGTQASTAQAREDVPQKIEVMQVAGFGPVILPSESVHDGQIWVVEDNRVTSQAVKAQDWRESYVRVDGLTDKTLVVLDNNLKIGQLVDYRVINPEAGQSGMMEI